MPRVSKEDLDALERVPDRPLRWSHRLACPCGVYMSVSHGTIPTETVAFFMEAHAAHHCIEEYAGRIEAIPS